MLPPVAEIIQAVVALCAIVTVIAAAVAAYVSLKTDARINQLEATLLKLLREYATSQEVHELRRDLQRCKDEHAACTCTRKAAHA